jgi:hypothetical protein
LTEAVSARKEAIDPMDGATTTKERPRGPTTAPKVTVIEVPVRERQGGGSANARGREGPGPIARLLIAMVGFGVMLTGFALMLSVFLVFIGLPLFVLGLAIMESQAG